MEFRAVDAYGNARPYVSGEVQLSVTGPGVLIGDNPFAFGDAGAAGAVWIRTLCPTPLARSRSGRFHPARSDRRRPPSGLSRPPGGPAGALGALAALVSRDVIILAAPSRSPPPLPTTACRPSRRPCSAARLAIRVDRHRHVGHDLHNMRSGQSVRPAGVRPCRAAPTADRRPHRAVHLHRGRPTSSISNASADVFVPYPSLAAAFTNPGITATAARPRAALTAAVTATGRSARRGRPDQGATVKTSRRTGVRLAGRDTGQPDNAPGSGRRCSSTADQCYRAGPAGCLHQRGRAGHHVSEYADAQRTLQLVYIDSSTARHRPGQIQGFSVGRRHDPLRRGQAEVPGNHGLRLRGHGRASTQQDRSTVDSPNRYDTVHPHRERRAHLRADHRDPVEYSLAGGDHCDNTSMRDVISETTDFDGTGDSYSAQALTAAGLHQEQQLPAMA